MDEKQIIFTVARMNPPTPGHMVLVKRMIREAIQKDVSEVTIILSNNTKDRDKDPITCLEKVDFMKPSNTMVDNVKKEMVDEEENKEMAKK